MNKSPYIIIDSLNARHYIVQVRNDQCGLLDFNQPYSLYQSGFGQPECDYWLGLDTLHAITSNVGRKYLLDVTMWFFLDTQLYQSYWHGFRVDDEANGYMIHMDSYGAAYGKSELVDLLASSIH